MNSGRPHRAQEEPKSAQGTPRITPGVPKARQGRGTPGSGSPVLQVPLHVYMYMFSDTQATRYAPGYAPYIYIYDFRDMRGKSSLKRRPAARHGAI